MWLCIGFILTERIGRFVANYANKLWMGGKTDKLKKMRHTIAYSMEELDEEK